MAFEQFITDARSLITLASFICFIGIVWWAYSGSRKADFEQAAMLPLNDDLPANSAESGHG